MPTEHRSAAGEQALPDLGGSPRQGMVGQIGRTEGGQHLGQAGRSVGLQKLEGRGGSGQLLLRQVEIAHGYADMAVTEQTQDGVDIDTRFEQIRGEGMARRMDAAVVGQAGRIAHGAVQALDGLIVDRAVAGAIGKHPAPRVSVFSLRGGSSS